MKKKLNLVLFLLLLCMAAGCDKKTVSTDGIRIYYRLCQKMALAPIIISRQVPIRKQL